jgi:hypothetical protein
MYAEIVFEKKTENDVAIAISSVLRSPTMEELADLATSELLQQEIDRLRVDNEHLQGSLLESQQHCHRLEEEASLLISGVKQQHDETDEDFKKRKQKIYNRRSYKRKKTTGSVQEENDNLITQLESLRGQLMNAQEKCERLSAKGINPIVDHIPGETDEQLNKRRQQIYNQRSYIKRRNNIRDNLQLQIGVAEIRRPTSVASLPVDNPIMDGLDHILSQYIKTHPRKWPLIFNKSRDIRLLNISYNINESGLIDVTRPKRASLDQSSAEIKRQFAIQFLDPNVKEWCDLFTLKASGLVRSAGLRPKAGLGLFAARPFKCGDRIAVYIGEIFDVEKLPEKKRTIYSLLFDIDKTGAPIKVRKESSTKSFIVDAGYCPKDSADSTKRPPVYFGIHYVNDPKWEPDGRHQPHRITRSTPCPPYNIEIGEDLVATTISDIEEGEELFWDYTAGTGVML